MATLPTYQSVRQTIEGALRLIGALATGESMTASQGQDHMTTLNQMLQQWNTDDLMVYTLDRQSFTLTGGKQQYSLGPGGDFDVQRPVQIQMASIELVATYPRTIEIPIDILNDEQWRDVSVKNTPSNFPLMIWVSGAYPVNQVYTWPVPTDPNNLILYTWGQTYPFTDLETSVAFPDGYDKAIRYNLAIDLAPEYGIQPMADVYRQAATSKQFIKNLNYQPSFMKVDSALLTRRGNMVAVKSQGRVVDP